MSLAAKAWISLALLVVAIALVLFAAAGSVLFGPAWVYLLVFSLASGWLTWYLIRFDPALLERRMHGGPWAEPEPTQQRIMYYVMIVFVALHVVPGIEYRLGTPMLPPLLIVLGDVLIAAGFYGIFLVYRVNTYTSATIAIAQGQTVITTGPYAVVRHPMYSASFLYLFGIPLALGSLWGMLVAVMFIPLLVWRIRHEEQYLTEQLRGYADYCKEVHYRLVPFVW